MLEKQNSVGSNWVSRDFRTPAGYMVPLSLLLKDFTFNISDSFHFNGNTYYEKRTSDKTRPFALTVGK